MSKSVFSYQAYASANDAQNLVSVLQDVKQSGVAFDSAEAGEVMASFDGTLAAKLGSILPDVERAKGSFSGAQVVGQAVLDGVQEFERKNGFSPNGGVIHSAIQGAFSMLGENAEAALRNGTVASFDSATALAGTSTGSFITNAAQLAIYTSIASAIPFGGYIPMDTGMTGKLLISGHRAGSTTGDYKEGQSINGIDGGKTFMSNVRTVKAETTDRTTFNATIKYAVEDVKGSRIVPHTAKVYVNGLLVLQAPASAPRAATSKLNLAGDTVIKVGGNATTFNISAVVNPEDGTAVIKSSSALPQGAEVHFEAGIDYEHATMQDKRPIVEAYVDPYEVTAHTHSGIFKVTAEAETQWRKEVGQSYEMRATLALRNQSANERHFKAIHDMYRIGKNAAYTFDMKAGARLGDRSRNSLFEDAFITIAQADQDMVEATGEFGIGVLYVGSKGKAYLSSLPEPTFIPSGIRGGAGIHRFGTLKGIPVYYVPNVLAEQADGFEMLAIGRSDQIGFNPYIVGDVTGAILERVGQNFNLQKGMTYFHSMVNQVNPNQQIASAAAVITFKNPD